MAYIVTAYIVMAYIVMARFVGAHRQDGTQRGPTGLTAIHNYIGP
jgi:hypothetical protein